MRPLFTIITPTYDHGETLRFPIECARRQTLQDFEHFIVGDGAVAAGREIARDYECSDARVRFFDNPKGEHYGELHRDAAVRQATGRFIAYLSDDDLWFDDHLERLAALLERADFGYTGAAFVHTDDSIGLLYSDITAPTYRDEMLAGENRIPASVVGHRLDAYKRLPEGWAIAPEGGYADLTCWRQFLEIDDMRYAFSGVVTMIHFQSVGSERGGWDTPRRVAELERWSARVWDAPAAAVLREELWELLFQHAADRQAESIHFQKLAAELEWLAEDRQREIDRRPSGLKDALRKRLAQGFRPVR